MEIDGILVITFPFLQIVRQGDTYALGLEIVGRIDATGIIEHDESVLL